MITQVRNGTLVTPDGVHQTDLWIDGETIVCVGPSDLSADRTVDATDCIVLPGGIDPHVHMGFVIGEFASSDNFETGSRAAALGGVTTILDFAVPEGNESICRAVSRRIDQARGRSAVDFGIHAVITHVDDELPSELKRCIMLGVPDFKTFTTYTGLRLTESALLSVMGRVQEVGGLIMVHAEDDAGIQQRVAELVHEGRLAPESHYLSRPAEVESTAIRSVLGLQAKTKCALHFAHVSAAESVEHIYNARNNGADVSAETCPHYLFQTSAVYQEDRAALFMVSPSIKTQADQDRLWAGLRERSIDMLATDHCPFTSAQKLKHDDFRQIPTGLPGVETTLPLLFTAWQDRGWPLERLADALSANPARRFGLYPRKGALRAGSDADVVVYAPQNERAIRAADLHMHVDWSPFEGLRIQGAVRDVFLRGTQLVRDGFWVGENAAGRYLHRSTSGLSNEKR